ncbi:MAG TPA: hypothetical protein VE685_04715 [Thermoanaerobaculia bacterium]|nr:hypothetical protein [Thermoanaerobaculia bacterium]
MAIRARRYLPLGLLACILAFAAGSWPEATNEKVETLVFPPYLDSVVLDLFSEQGEIGVDIFAPDAPHRPLTAAVEGVEEIRLGQSLRTVIIERPQPGRWVFRKPRPKTRVRILSQQFFPRGALLQPRGGETLRQHDHVFITYQVMDDNGSPLRELPGYPLAVEISLVRPGGHRLSLDMERRPELGSGVFRTPERIECSLPGRYWTEVVLTTRDLTGRKVKVLQDRWSGFSVRAAGPRHLRRVPVSFLANPAAWRPSGGCE